MDTSPNRRRFLQLTAGAGTVSVAGCSQLDSTDDEPATDDESDDSTDEADDSANEELTGDDEPDIDPEDGITAFVEPDEEGQAELMERQQELLQEVEEGDLSEEEFQIELQQFQAELNAEAAAEFEAYVDDSDDLSIEGAVPESGLLLIDGTDSALVETLRDDIVVGLLPGAQFEALQQPQ